MRRQAWVNVMVVLGLLTSSGVAVPQKRPVARAAATAAILYVKPGGIASGNCDSWANACELQYALRNVATDGDEIWVAEGTYKPTSGTDRSATFQLRSGVAIYGGFAGTEDTREERDWVAHPTILSGNIGAVSASGDNSYHVVTGNDAHATAVLDGFTVTGGRADGYYNPWASCDEACGGGMSNTWGSPTVRNVSFSGNYAYIDGGGMYNLASNPTLTYVTFSGNLSGWYGGGMCNLASNPTLTDVTFSHNTAYIPNGSTGGGMCNRKSNPTLTHVTFIANTARSGGGMSNHPATMDNVASYPTLKDVTFSQNTVTENGGGMYNDQSSPTLTNVTFSDNTALSGGGVYNLASSPTLTGTQFISNIASSGGGMCNGWLSSPTLTDVTFSHNTVTQHGGGMYNDSSSPALTNVTFNDNSANESGAGMYNRNNSSPALAFVTFSDNRADADSNDSGNGGGIYNEDSSPSGKLITFTHNTATAGGGMYNLGSSPELTRATFSGNTAQGGGGMVNLESSPTLHYFTFISNTATSNGGGMVNSHSSPELAIGLFGGNRADADGVAGGGGGGMVNEGVSSPTLINVTLSGNSAADGGGMYSDGLSTPNLKNTIVWDNSATDGAAQIVGLVSGGTCLVEGGYSGCLIQDATTPFVDADGADDIPGTPDDDLRLAYPSKAIDAGDKDALPAGLLHDLAGNPRVFGVDMVGEPAIDLGAYEDQCYGSYMTQGDDWLVEGQKYRQGFHAELVGPASVTISDTLDAYAAERASGNLTNARGRYEAALACPDLTDTEKDQAVARILDVMWELATGAMLQGNEELVQVLDVTNAGAPATAKAEALTRAINLYAEATAGYLEPLAGDRYPGLLAALQLTRSHPITASGTMTPTHVDLERLAMAAAQKSRAYLELAEHQFRDGDKGGAEGTLRQGFNAALVELTLLYTLWPQIVDEDDVNYIALLRHMGDMERLYSYLVGDKNPLGYGPDFVPFYFDHDELPKNNYEQTIDWVRYYRDSYAEPAISEAGAKKALFDDNYKEYQDRRDAIRREYDDELENLCGADGDKPDLQVCDGGEINQQLLAIKNAVLRVDRVLQQMENQNRLIEIEQERIRNVTQIDGAIVELIKDNGERLADLAAQEARLRFSKNESQGALGIVNGICSGAFSGAGGVGEMKAAPGLSFGMAGIGAVVGGLTAWADWKLQEQVAEELADVAAQRERLYAYEKAEIRYADSRIRQEGSLALQREYFLKFAELEIDYAIAMNDLMQELARLKGLQTRTEYLLAEKARAEAFTDLLFRDPAGRVLRNHWMERAHSRFENTLDYTYHAARALEYEINEGVTFMDNLYRAQNLGALDDVLEGIEVKYNSWTLGFGSPTEYPPIEPIYLSQALGFETHFDPDLGRTVTREEQFNAFIRDPANRIDLDYDGTPESLKLTFQTSILPGNNDFDTGLYNDKIVSVDMRVRGNSLGTNQVTIKLTQGGTSFIRTRDAFKVEDEWGNCLDDVQAYNLEPKRATIVAVTNDDLFPAGATSYGLASRSVAATEWTLLISRCANQEKCGPNWVPANLALNLDNMDEIELWITHEAYTLQDTCEPQLFEAAPNQAYRPMGQVLPPFSITWAALEAGGETPTAQASAVHLNATFIGAAVITEPLYMPARDLIVVLTDTNGGLSGYISPTLSYPVMPGTDRGPAVLGSWSGTSFHLHSEPFTTVITTGVPITRRVFLQTGVISESGKILTGVYSETLAGLIPESLKILGGFRLDRVSANRPTMIFLPLVLRNY